MMDGTCSSTSSSLPAPHAGQQDKGGWKHTVVTELRRKCQPEVGPSSPKADGRVTVARVASSPPRAKPGVGPQSPTPRVIPRGRTQKQLQDSDASTKVHILSGTEGPLPVPKVGRPGAGGWGQGTSDASDRRFRDSWRETCKKTRQAVLTSTQCIVSDTSSVCYTGICQVLLLAATRHSRGRPWRHVFMPSC